MIMVAVMVMMMMITMIMMMLLLKLSLFPPPFPTVAWHGHPLAPPSDRRRGQLCGLHPGVHEHVHGRHEHGHSGLWRLVRAGVGEWLHGCCVMISCSTYSQSILAILSLKGKGRYPPFLLGKPGADYHDWLLVRSASLGADYYDHRNNNSSRVGAGAIDVVRGRDHRVRDLLCHQSRHDLLRPRPPGRRDHSNGHEYRRCADIDALWSELELLQRPCSACQWLGGGIRPRTLKSAFTF
jgi:hypothetical protein